MIESVESSLHLQQHDLVMQLTQLNSSQLRCDSERNGLDFELLGVRSRIEDREATPEEVQEITDLEKKIETVVQKQKAQRQKIEELEKALHQLQEG